ncbi:MULTISPECIES: asparaginase [unclassified Campylobacter]|uniref:asparaginase n=1 Tax=unclassified Campylobacter TaxID=2593542 RepID=UPI0012383A75|nr:MULTISPECIES: asparaginase [unclassified Campylobacter]KAA6225072.1 asparaginase [Campylobacter sp. LR196d]KAA6226085.1 asparaginase [Campylobacter sp. LR185c]KAA6228031.1 asparaginase [Campylobacter sp. LR286c]KAA6231286.1 asparaginase [Campylobacter sp. LR264d]KAA6231497.1 asparaginase [Campylobacter sp. LR291e]
MQEPRIAILATGGTIAGLSKDNLSLNYKAGVLSIDSLIKSLPKINAKISTYQISNIDSCDMDDEIQIKLAKKINELFEKDIDGIVVTHGSDTLEESAYFIQLSVKSNKPVIFTASMRPFFSLSSDGPKNLYNAIILATKSKGVLISINDKIFSPRVLSKTHTLNLNAFSSPNELGYIVDNDIFFYEKNKKAPFDIDKITTLPKVDILYSYSNDGNAISAKALFENGTKGLVIAGSGAGSIHKNLKNVLKELIKKGLIIVVSTRVAFGSVILSKEDIKLGFISALDLNPQKARILLILALSKTKNIQKIQKYFLKY